MPFKRICKKCNKTFQPIGKYQRLCEPCQKEIKNVNFIKLIASRNGIGLKTIQKNW